jgi:hypothetical protein
MNTLIYSQLKEVFALLAELSPLLITESLNAEFSTLNEDCDDESLLSFAIRLREIILDYRAKLELKIEAKEQEVARIEREIAVYSH